jgi:hypothetical protein
MSTGSTGDTVARAEVIASCELPNGSHQAIRNGADRNASKRRIHSVVVQTQEHI